MVRIETESGGPGYAYGNVRHPFPGAQRPTSLERPAQASPEVTELPDRLGRAGITDVAGHDPGGDADDSGTYNISSMMGNVGGVNASQNSSVVAVDPLDPSKLVAVWIDNDPTMFADTDDEIASVVEAAYSTDAGANGTRYWPNRSMVLGFPAPPLSIIPPRARPHRSLYQCLQSEPGIRRLW